MNLPWPFTTAELTAGLRRYFAEPTLRVTALHEQPSTFYSGTTAAPTRVRGLRAEYAVGEHALSVVCAVKEPQGASRAGLAGAGRREAGVYRAFTGQLPMPVPTLIAADPAGEWLIFEAVDIEVPPAEWRAEHYHHAVCLLAELHERFWNLGDDLAAYPWLARPLTGDFEIHVFAAAQALAKLIADDWPPMVTHSTEALRALGQIVTQADHIAAPLRALPYTLLHGNLWPGNVALQHDGEMVVYDWRLAAVGPGILDVVAFIFNSQWMLGALPVEGGALVAEYRAELQRRLGVQWADADWQRLWDHALLWRFLQDTLAWLASVAPAAFTTRAAESFQRAWLAPVLAAAQRRLLKFET